MVEGATSELANWSKKSPKDGSCKEDLDRWTDELLGLIESANVEEPLKQEISEPNLQESRHNNSENLS